METRKKEISPLRQRMIEDMHMRRFADATQSDYIRAVSRFGAYLGRSPDTATVEDWSALDILDDLRVWSEKNKIEIA